MPQLDANTFIYQYVGIITLLVVVYYLLSYVVLPVLLRSSLIRSALLNSSLTGNTPLSSPSLQLSSLGMNSSSALSLFENVLSHVTKITKSSTSRNGAMTSYSSRSSTPAGAASIITEVNFTTYLSLFIQAAEDTTNE